MSFLSELHQDNTTQISINQTSSTHISSSITLNLIEYTTSCIYQQVTSFWEMDFTKIPISENITSTLYNLIDRNYQLTRPSNSPMRLTGLGDYGYIVETICKKMQLFYGCNVSLSDRCIEITNSNENNTITEEHNTSLMYHKLFPNNELLRELEKYGYKFEMGNGIKLHKQFFASKHRNKSGPSRQRTIQTLIIFKNGQMYRQIPKSQWVLLVDPSNAKSKTWGEVFMQKLLAHEKQIFDSKIKAANS